MTGPLTPDAIIEAAAKIVGTTVEDITRPDGRRVALAPGEHPRSWLPAEARRCAMYLMYTHLGLSYRAIGGLLNRSGRGVVYGVRHVRDRLEAKDEPTTKRLDAILTGAQAGQPADA